MQCYKLMQLIKAVNPKHQMIAIVHMDAARTCTTMEGLEIPDT